MSGENNNFSSDTVNLEEIKTKFTDILLQDIIPKILPMLLDTIKEEIVTLFLPTIKLEVKKLTTDFIPSLKTEIKTELLKSLPYKDYAKSFIEKNYDHLNKLNKDREAALYKEKRCKKLIQIYNDGLNSTPIYVPKLYRQDKYHVNSTIELEILKNREINDLTSEIEILKLRELENIRKIEDIDNDIRFFVGEKVQNTLIQEEIMKILEIKNKKYLNSVEKEWGKKILSLQKSFEKDKSFIARHNSNRIKRHNRNYATVETVSTQSATIDLTTETSIPIIPTSERQSPTPSNTIEYDPITDDEIFDENDESVVLFPNTQENQLIQMMGEKFSSDDDESKSENFQLSQPFERPRRQTRSQTKR